MTDSNKSISALRQRMIDDMTLRKLSPKTQAGYLRAVIKFTLFFGRSRDGGIDGGAGYTLFDLLQLKCAQILGRSQIGGAAKEKGKLDHRPQVGGLGLWVEPAQSHVIDHALTQWAGRMLNGHGSVSCVVG
jgi:hypothetical protein